MTSRLPFSRLPFPTDRQFGTRYAIEEGQPCQADCGVCPQCQAAWDVDNAPGDEEDALGCDGHESLDGAHMGEAVYCDGSCIRRH